MDLASQLHETLLVDQLFLLNVVHSAFVIHGRVRQEINLFSSTIKKSIYFSFIFSRIYFFFKPKKNSYTKFPKKEVSRRTLIHGIKKWLDAKKRPLASFILTFINCYISGLLVNLVCNTPLLSSMKNNELNCAIVLLWWLVNFATPGFFDFILGCFFGHFCQLQGTLSD